MSTDKVTQYANVYLDTSQCLTPSLVAKRNLIHAIPTLVDLELSVLPEVVRLSASVQLVTKEIHMPSVSVEIVNMIMNVPVILLALITTVGILALELVAEMPTVRYKTIAPSVHVHKDSLEIHFLAVTDRLLLVEDELKLQLLSLATQLLLVRSIVI